MRPTKTEECNVTLTLPGGTEDNDLPAVRAMLYDASRGQTERDAEVGFQTFWDPDETERLAIAAGAPVRLTLWGKGHPPVALGVEIGSENVADGLLSVKRVGRALAALYAELRDQLWVVADQSSNPGAVPGAIGTASEFVDRWERLFDQVAEADAADRELADQLLTAATAGIDPEAVAAEVAGEIPAPDTGLGDPNEGDAPCDDHKPMAKGDCPACRIGPPHPGDMAMDDADRAPFPRDPQATTPPAVDPGVEEYDRRVTGRRTVEAYRSGNHAPLFAWLADLAGRPMPDDEDQGDVTVMVGHAEGGGGLVTLRAFHLTGQGADLYRAVESIVDAWAAADDA